MEDRRLPIDKLLDIEKDKYKIAVAAFRRVYQIADNERIKSMITDSKRLPVIALSDVLEKKVEMIEESEDEEQKMIRG